MARTDTLQVERDGTNGGFGIRVLQSLPFLQAASFGATAPSTPFVAYQDLSNLAPNTVKPLIVNNNNTVYFRCQFGDTESPGHITTLELFRGVGGGLWAGSLTSSYDQ